MTTHFEWYTVSDATVALLFGLAGVLGGYALRGLIGKWQADTIEKKAKLKLDEVDVEVKSKMKEADILARAEVVKAKEEFEKSTKARRKELQDIEDRLTIREENMDKKAAILDKKEQAVTQKQEEILSKAEDLQQKRVETDRRSQEADARLQKLASMTYEEAKKELYQRAEQEVKSESGHLIRKIQEEAKETAEKEAARIVAMAIQRYSIDHASETMTTTVQLPSDDVKGRIIGREGRNIRTLEAVTGMTMLVDDTPEAVVISGFDPVRREVARLALEELLTDGRIHPGRIEELVEKSQQAVDEMIREAGERATFETGVTGMHPELVRLIGKLRFRTSFGQNVLRHSIEVSHLAGAMAAEIGARVSVARRAGLLHDLGKAVDFERDGPHALIGAEIASRRGENKDVVEALVSHHDDEPVKSVEGALVQAADAISAGRPGARREALESYLKRLDNLEKIAGEFEGVEKSFAIQAGREIRVMVKPEKIDDLAAHRLARAMASRIEEAMDYPGQIRVTVIRETRAIEFAK
jgi:ribonuclease Y